MAFLNIFNCSLCNLNMIYLFSQLEVLIMKKSILAFIVVLFSFSSLASAKDDITIDVFMFQDDNIGLYFAEISYNKNICDMNNYRKSIESIISHIVNTKNNISIENMTKEIKYNSLKCDFKVIQVRNFPIYKIEDDIKW